MLSRAMALILDTTAERKLITGVLSETGWNRKKAAKILGVGYKAILYQDQGPRPGLIRVRVFFTLRGIFVPTVLPSLPLFSPLPLLCEKIHSHC